jgi:hypothetical protein
VDEERKKRMNRVIKGNKMDGAGDGETNRDRWMEDQPSQTLGW